MGWIILTILLGIAFIVSVIVWRKSSPLPPGSTDEFPAKGAGLAFAIILAVVWGVLTFAFAATQIGAGHIGVKYVFGKITGTVDPGFHFVQPWADVVSANTQVQSHTFPALTSFSRETQNVNVIATLNYNVSPGDVKNLYTTVGPDWFNKLVETRVNQFFKDETVKFKAVNIAPNRDRIRRDVRARLKLALTPYSVNVVDLLIDNITFSQAFTTAIEDKQIATQQAQAAQNRVATARYQAEQLIATAKGQAKAQQLRRQTLTPLLVEQNAIDKLNPNVQVIMVPAGSNFLLPNLLSQPPAATTRP